MNKEEIGKLQSYLQHKFGNSLLKLKTRPKNPDSCEVYIGEEFIGLLYLDDEDGDRSFMFQMSILDIDLDELDEI